MDDGQLSIDPAIYAISPENAAEKKGAEAPPATLPPPPKPQPSESHQKETGAFRPDQAPWWKGTLEIVAIAVGICGLFVYWNQLSVMSGQLAQMQGSSGQTDKLIFLYQKQLEQLTKQAGDTHDLAVQTKSVADQAVIQAKAARSAADTASRQLEATDRPWIKIIGAVADHPVTYHTSTGIATHGDDFINLGIKVIVQNVGKSAALDVVTRADVVFISMISGAPNNPFKYPVAMQKALCSKPANAAMSINLFPGEDNREETGDDHDIPTTRKTFIIPQDPESLPRLMPYFVGCVDYKIGVSGKIHQSGFIYSVEQAMPGRENRGLLILGNDIPMADVRMQRFVFGGFDAD